MTKKSFVVILILSIIVAIVADILEGLINDTFIGGKSGFPFKDSLSLGLEGGTSYTNMFILNILFWFLVIWGIWKLSPKLFKKR